MVGLIDKVGGMSFLNAQEKKDRRLGPNSPVITIKVPHPCGEAYPSLMSLLLTSCQTFLVIPTSVV